MEWYYYASGERKGPVDEAGLREKARAGEIKPSDHLWNETMGSEWVKAVTIPDLFSADPEPEVAPPAAATEASPASPDPSGGTVEEPAPRPETREPDPDLSHILGFVFHSNAGAAFGRFYATHVPIPLGVFIVGIVLFFFLHSAWLMWLGLAIGIVGAVGLLNLLPRPRGGHVILDAIVIIADDSGTGIDMESTAIEDKLGPRGEAWAKKGQALLQFPLHSFDRITVVTKDGREVVFYFDITSFYGRW